MSSADFAREIERASRRMVELRRAARNDASASWVEAALAELSSAMEELKVAEEELSSQNRDLAEANADADFERFRYRELFMGSPFGQLVTDLRGVITEANRAAGDLLGTPSANLVGKPLALMIAQGDRERFVRWVAVLKDASHDATVCADCGGSGDFAMQTADRGRLFPCEVIAAPMADRLGRIESIRWCVRDNTDRERARTAELLREEARRKDEFLAVLSHELRNPLSAIRLAADILTGQGVDAARKRWASDVVLRHAEHLHRLVDDLLDASRISHGKLPVALEPVDLGEEVRAAVATCHPILEGKGHQVVVAVPPEPVIVQGVGWRLRQVVCNLVDNAAKYTAPGGRVEVEVTGNGVRAAITVRDSGVGIPAHLLETLFSAGEPEAGSNLRRERGLGLGLALVRQLVSLHGGTVRAESDGEDKGSSFTVELPIHGGAVSAAAGSNGKTTASQEGNRILIVDDNSDAADLLAEKLRRMGYQVAVAFDGKGGLAAARRASCQVALVDLGLPDLDGFEVCRALKEAQPALQVVALTGYSDSRSRDQASRAGFDRFLVKPLDPREVVKALEELLGPPS